MFGLPLGGAVAGNELDEPVQVGPSNARGALGSARNSANSLEYIRCASSAQADSAGASRPSFNILCEAYEPPSAAKPNGATGYCSVVDSSDMATSLGGLPFMSQNAYLEFAWDANHTCTYIAVRLASHNEPKER